MNRHHRRAGIAFAAVLGLDVLLGFLLAWSERVPAWHGVYCTIGLTTTDGCDISFHDSHSYIIATVAMVLFVPLWSGVFSLVTTGFIADHVDGQA